MKVFAEILVACIAGIVNTLLSGFVIWLCWPVMVALGLPALSYIQSCSLFILARTLIDAPAIRYKSKL